MIDAALATHLLHLEESLVQPEIRHNPNLLASLLADDLREFGSSGHIFDKHDVLAELASESPCEIVLSGFRCDPLAPGLAHVTYRATRLNPNQPPLHSLRSSLWIHRDGRWRMLFHQGTKA